MAISVVLLAAGSTPRAAAEPETPDFRRPPTDGESRYWLENMLQHRFSDAEITAATGLSKTEIASALEKFQLRRDQRPLPPQNGLLRVLPYPGGRHPRIGFLEGAIRPQRETKVSVFLPWDAWAYVVVDVPEAIWSNLGLTYLAHTHVPTVWTRQNVELPPLEWDRLADGSLHLERKLPNGIVFASKVVPGRDAVRMELTLTNNTTEKLTDLRVQNCVMLKQAPGFEQQTNENKVLSKPYCACRNAAGDRWIITAWQPCHRPWGNAACPCLHSDPKFADCAPGETQRLRGWLSFYEGSDIEAEFRRIEATGWHTSSR